MKKSHSYIGLSLIILLFGIFFIPKIVDRLNNDEVVTSDRLNVEGSEKVGNKAALTYIKVNGKKKKAPAFKLINQTGDTITNKDYLGKVYVAEFFFTTCPSICPIMNKNLVQVQKEFEGVQNFGIASFSIDPSHDSVEVLKTYAEDKGITHENWNLLTGEKDDIYGLANGGFNIYAGENEAAPGGFAHQGLFALVDKEGYIRSRKDKQGNPIIYYRGSVPRDKIVEPGEEEPQINILIEDIKKLL